MDCSPLGSSDNGISQARILEWVAVSSSRGSSPPRDQTESPESANSLPMSHHGNKLNHSSSKDFGFQTFKTQHWVKKKGSCWMRFLTQCHLFNQMSWCLLQRSVHIQNKSLRGQGCGGEGNRAGWEPRWGQQTEGQRRLSSRWLC